MLIDNAASEDVQVAMGRNEVVAPPYVSFNTVKNLLDWLNSEGVPLRLDRSFWQASLAAAPAHSSWQRSASWACFRGTAHAGPGEPC